MPSKVNQSLISSTAPVPASSKIRSGISGGWPLTRKTWRRRRCRSAWKPCLDERNRNAGVGDAGEPGTLSTRRTYSAKTAAAEDSAQARPRASCT